MVLTQMCGLSRRVRLDGVTSASAISDVCCTRSPRQRTVGLLRYLAQSGWGAVASMGSEIRPNLRILTARYWALTTRADHKIILVARGVQSQTLGAPTEEIWKQRADGVSH